jgi:hypothetical protein
LFSKEFAQAATYYSNIRTHLGKKGTDRDELLADVICNEMNCYIKLKNYRRASELEKQLEDLGSEISESNNKGKIYQVLAILAISMKRDNFNYYEEKTYNCFANSALNKSRAEFEFACAMFETGLTEMAISYIKKGLDEQPEKNSEGRVKYMIDCIGQLVQYNILNLAQQICDEASNIAIVMDNIKFIEKTYYYKALILQKKGDYATAEMYMNLSMDALFKCGNKSERYERYIDMGRMYHKLGQVQDALKYLSLAMYLEKKL